MSFEYTIIFVSQKLLFSVYFALKSILQRLKRVGNRQTCHIWVQNHQEISFHTLSAKIGRKTVENEALKKLAKKGGESGRQILTRFNDLWVDNHIGTISKLRNSRSFQKHLTHPRFNSN